MDKRSHKSLISFGVASLLAVGAATAQVAGTSNTTMIDSSGNYRQEVQACLNGSSQQDRETCMTEARNAAAAKRRGNLDTYGNHESHARARCAVHGTGEDRAACEARVMGMGNIEGSVAGGGLLREVETVVLPPDAKDVTIQARTDEPVILVPADAMTR